MIARNPDGSEKWRRHNVLTLRGRLYQLEQLFGESPASGDITGEPSTFETNKRTRTIVGFRVGGGSTAEDSDQYGLATALNFRNFIGTTAANNQNDTDFTAGAAQRDKYFSTTTGGVKEYHTKKLETQTSDKWEYSTTTDTTARKTVIRIDAFDFVTSHGGAGRNADGDASTDQTTLRELGLWIGTDGGSGELTADTAEMFSRIVFPAETFSGSKAMSVDYYVYA